MSSRSAARPTIHLLDLRLEKTVALERGTKMKVRADVFNAFDINVVRRVVLVLISVGLTIHWGMP